jgi:hypothetical protein
MLPTTLSQQTGTRIKVSRIGHFYYLDEVRNGNVHSLNEHIHRDKAIEVVTSVTSGSIPQLCNFDTCHPRNWSWRWSDGPEPSFTKATVTVKGRTFRAQVKVVQLPDGPAYSVNYHNEEIALRPCGDGTYCEKTGGLSWHL